MQSVMVLVDRITWGGLMVCGLFATLSADGTGWRIACVILTTAAVAGLVVSLVRPESLLATSPAAMVVLMLIVLTSLGEERRDTTWWLLVALVAVAALSNVISLVVTAVRRRREGDERVRSSRPEGPPS